MRIISGKWRGRVIEAPTGRDTRPTADRVREAWFSAAQPYLEDARVLDLFAGSGALGLEALSRGARSATFVENAARALRTLQSNIAQLGAGPQCEVVRADAIAWTAQLAPGAYDVAFADPPYGQGLADALARLYREAPFADVLWIEHRTADPLPELPGARTREYGDTALTFIPAPA